MVHFSDFISDSSRSNFNGFENIPNDGTFFTGGNGPYVEDSISVQQINGDSDTWVTYNYGGQHQSNYSWYPNGGDSGYTEITLSGGLDFSNVGMMIGSGYGTSTFTFYELLDNGTAVLSGYYPSVYSGYLGFSGGGFDTIRLSDCSFCDPLTTTMTDGHFQALAVDSIEISAVPEPETYVMLLAGLSLLSFMTYRRRKSVV